MDVLVAALRDFWHIVVTVWNQNLFRASVGDWLLAFGVFAVCYWLRDVFTRFAIATLERLARRTPMDFDNKVVAAAKGPLRFMPIVLGLYLGLLIAHIPMDKDTNGLAFVKSLVAITIFWALYNAVTPLTDVLSRFNRVVTQEMIDWTVKAFKAFVILLGAVSVLEFWDIKVAPVIAGLGLFGVAVALGAQDMFKNLIAGLLILSEKRFHKGDWILVDGVVEGTVEMIGFRSTRIRRFDKAPVYVPNAQLADNPVTNFSGMTHRRIRWIIGVEYRTTIDQLRQIRDRIEDYILGNEDFAHGGDVAAAVRIEGFNDSSIDILLQCFTKTTVWAEWLAIKEKLAYRVKEIVEEAGTGFAFPGRSLYVESLPGESPEIFVPPSDERGSAALAGAGRKKRLEGKAGGKARVSEPAKT